MSQGWKWCDKDLRQNLKMRIIINYYMWNDWKKAHMQFFSPLVLETRLMALLHMLLIFSFLIYVLNLQSG